MVFREDLKKMLRTAVLCALVALCTASVCVKSYQKIGCKAKNRAIFTDALANNRDKGSNVFTGEILEWRAFGESINKLACQCQEKAKEGGYVAFALGFYGECYGAKDRMAVLGHVDADGGLASHKCMDGLFQTGCGKDHEGECVGVADAEYIYTLDNNNKASDTQHNGNKQNEEEENEKVDGGLGEWTEWTTCSESCGEGIQDRERLCNNPSPANGGKDCKDLGELTKTKTCKIKDCPVNGNWSEWFEDGECSVSCGGGVQKLTRTCTNPKPQFGGEDCKGENEKSQTCGTKECPVNGNWSDWSNYEKCSVSCGGGVQKRTRTCTNPKPKFDGEDCDGDSEETQNCGTKECPINGGWSSWGSYGSCSKLCGGGLRTQTRSCTNPKPQYKGNQCSGGTTQHQACNTHHCPINGGWSSWGSYGSCSKLCGGGLRTRTRSCTNPKPQYKGNQCSGGTTQHQTCNTNHCPVHGGWSSWGSYGSCSRSCGGGSQTRRRTCSNPTPQYNGRTCSGSSSQAQSCKTNHCPVHASWSGYGSYGSCSKTCHYGRKTKYRTCRGARYGGRKTCSGSSSHTINCNVNVRCPFYTAFHSNKVCEGGWMKMYCTDKNQKMKLDGSYFYGRKNKSSCKGGIDWFWSTSCSGGRSKVYNACQNKNECKIYANNSWMGGDPCRGTPKYYYVNFRCYG